MKSSIAVREWVALGLVLAAAAWLRVPALRAPFFADDYLFLDQARGRSLFAALAAPDPIGNFVRPVGRALWFWLLGHASGEAPEAFHAANLALLLIALVLLFVLVRAIAGGFAAVIAAAFVALSHAPDVAVRWAAGAQDLLAVTLALAALVLHRGGRRWWAAVCLVLALLSKETVVATPLIAALVTRREGERPRDSLARAGPLFAACAAWAVVWLGTAAARPAAGAALSFAPANLPAALAHLVQTAVGREWAPGGALQGLGILPPLVPLALALAALGFARGPAPPVTHRGAVGAGLAWALLGALPVVVVAPIWSAYFYLFALGGVALALGAALARAPRLAALAVVAALAWGAAGARGLDEFAQKPDAWATLSHVNPRYLERAGEKVSELLAGLKSVRPTLTPGSTVYFSGTPAWSGVQAGGGPMLRWAYRDTSLRADFTSRFSRAGAGRGPVLFYSPADPQRIRTADTPGLLENLALNLLLDDAVVGAREAILMRDERLGPSMESNYLLAWMALALGDAAEARQRLAVAGTTSGAAAAAEIEAALREVARGDTLAAFRRIDAAVGRNVAEPGVHALLADLALARPEWHSVAIIEAFAARALSPEWPAGWRRWAMLQAMDQRYPAALASLDRFFALAGPDGARDPSAIQFRDDLRRRVPGGDLARASVHDGGEDGR